MDIVTTDNTIATVKKCFGKAQSGVLPLDMATPLGMESLLNNKKRN